MLERIFKTSGGSVYLKDSSTDLWYRECKEKEPGVRYLGSINVSANAAIEDDGKIDLQLLYEQMHSGVVPGFSPDYRLGYCPLGIVGDLDDIVGISEQGPKLRENATPRLHVGHKIIAIFKRIPGITRRVTIPVKKPAAK